MQYPLPSHCLGNITLARFFCPGMKKRQEFYILILNVPLLLLQASQTNPCASGKAPSRTRDGWLEPFFRARTSGTSVQWDRGIRGGSKMETSSASRRARSSSELDGGRPFWTSRVCCWMSYTGSVNHGLVFGISCPSFSTISLQTAESHRFSLWQHAMKSITHQRRTSHCSLNISHNAGRKPDIETTYRTDWNRTVD